MFVSQLLQILFWFRGRVIVLSTGPFTRPSGPCIFKVRIARVTKAFLFEKLLAVETFAGQGNQSFRLPLWAGSREGNSFYLPFCRVTVTTCVASPRPEIKVTI